jgi:hypothetical protein
MKFFLFHHNGVTHALALPAVEDVSIWVNRIWSDIFGNGWLAGVIQ